MKYFKLTYWGMLNRILQLQEVQMAAIDDLKAAVVILQTTVDTAVAKITALEANDAAIAQAATDITTAATKLGAA